jgi:transcription factor C subunit 6
MPRGRPRRVTKKVDYAQFGGAEGDSEKDADVVMDLAHESEHDDEPLEDAGDDDGEEMIEEERFKDAKKTRKTKKAAPEKSAIKKRGSVKVPLTHDSRALKDFTSVKDKFQRLFGYNNEKLSDIINLRLKWGAAMFDFDTSMLSEPGETNVFDVPLMKANLLTRDELYSKFPLESCSLNFQIDEQEIEELPLGGTRHSENLSVTNTGTLITDMAWCPKRSGTQLIALSVSNITSTPFNAKFSLLARNEYISGFYIYEIDPESNEVTLRNVLIHNWGNSWDLKWVNVKSGLGSLCAVFNDGNFRMINLGDLKNPYLEIAEASMVCEIEGHSVSTFDVLENRIICGTSTGHIAEFVAGDPSPSYLFRLHTDYIFSLRIGTSKYDETHIYTTSGDCTSMLSSLTDLRTSMAKSSKTKTMSSRAAYSPQLYTFVQTENPNPVKAVVSRAFFANYPLLKSDGSTECISCSDMHPMLLAGGADGKVKITNIARRVLNGFKAAPGSHRVLTLFQLQYGANEESYRLARTLEVENISSNEFATVENVYPSNVNFTTCKWNVNKDTGNWFAAGTSSGLLILCKL